MKLMRWQQHYQLCLICSYSLSGVVAHNAGPLPERSQRKIIGELFLWALQFFRARQRSGEGVVRRNGCPKGCFWRVRFFSASLKTLRGAEKKRTLQKHPFGQPFLCTTPSPLLWRALRRSFACRKDQENFLLCAANFPPPPRSQRGLLQFRPVRVLGRLHVIIPGN